MEDFVWEEEVEVDCPPAEYYTKEEVDELLSSLYQRLAKAHNEVISEVNRRGNSLYMRMNNLVAEVQMLEETFKGMSEEINRYLLPEKEERKRKALERLNSGVYDFDDEEEEEEQIL